MLNGLSLFSGIGGIEKGLQEWVTTRAYCEIDPYACAVLRSRMQDGQLDKGVIYGNIKELTGEQVTADCGGIDIITGGFPCQDISNAGKRRGIKAERSGLWFEMARLTSEIRPRYLFVENVGALINRGLSEVLGSLAEIGYDAVWTTLRASDVGAPHRRERFFLLGYPQHAGQSTTKNIGEYHGEQLEAQTKQELSCDEPARGSSVWSQTSNVAYPNEFGCELCGGTERQDADILPQVGEAPQSEQSRSGWLGGIEQIRANNVPDPNAAGQQNRTAEYRREQAQGREGEHSPRGHSTRTNTENLPDTTNIGCGGREDRNRIHGQSMEEQKTQEQPILRGEATRCDRNPREWWRTDPANLNPKAESFVGGMAHEFPEGLDYCGFGYTPRVTAKKENRVDRIKCLGNAVVPAQAREAFKRLFAIKGGFQ